MSLSQKIADVEEQLKAFSTQIEAGEQIDLKGFDDEVKAIFDEAKELPKEEVMPYKSRLREVRGNLQILQKNLDEHFITLKQKLEEEELKKKSAKVVKAYKASYKL